MKSGVGLPEPRAVRVVGLGPAHALIKGEEMRLFRKLFGNRHLPDTTTAQRIGKPVLPLDSSRVAAIGAFESGDEDVRVKAAIELSRFPGEATLSALARGLSDPSPKVRGCCAESLRLLRNPSTVNALVDVLLNDTEHDPAYYAAKALGAIGTQAAVTGLLSALEQRKGDLSEVAFQLGELRAPGATAPLTRALDDKESEQICAYSRRHIVMALEKIGDRRAVPSLKLALSDEDSGVRERAQRALSAFGEAATPSNPFSDLNGCILHYNAQETADRDFDIVLDLFKANEGFRYDIGVAEVDDSYSLIVTSNRPDIRQAFRELVLPNLSGTDLEFSNETKLPAMFRGAARLIRHQFISG
jgi:hypothetical protein